MFLTSEESVMPTFVTVHDNILDTVVVIGNMKQESFSASVGFQFAYVEAKYLVSFPGNVSDVPH